MFKKKLRAPSEKGQALILSYITITVLVVYAGALLTKAFSERFIAERTRLKNETFYFAEGAIEDALSAFTSGIANFALPASIGAYNHTTTFTTFDNTTVNAAITRLEVNDRVIVENGTNVYVANYEAVATATHPQNNAIATTIRQIFARRLIPTFQHAVFYNNDLEVLPGPNMTLSGRIHSNKDIYLDSDGNTLTIDSTSLHGAGDIFNCRKDAVGAPEGQTQILVNQAGPPTYEYMNGLDSGDANWMDEATNRWQGSVQSAVHGINELTTPAVGSIQPGGYYANQADVVITNNTIVKNGVTLTEDVDYPVGTIASSTAFYNNREGKSVRMTTLDLSRLAGLSGTCGGNPCPNNLPSNGLLYATRTDAGGTEEPGIKLTNGEEIARDAGLTVVSNAPVYIRGNYNTTDEKPASVMGDSLNLLSKTWNDANSTLNVNSRVADTTTYNCAFVAGIDETTTGHYNGGLENYPRLHEKWTSKNLNIKGSFVALWESAIATGDWVYGNPQYTAPIRSWQYNTAFNDPAKLPPFTPWAVEARRIAWSSD
jgi:hypothetical protein